MSESIYDFNSPPIMPGQKISDVASECAIYPKLDQKSSIQGWDYYHNGNEQSFADKDEVFVSPLTTVNNGFTGRDEQCIIGIHSIYVIKTKGSDVPSIVKIKNDETNISKTTNHVICGLFHRHKTIQQPKPKDQLIYCRQQLKGPRVINSSKQKYNFSSCVLKDVYDKDFSIKLPFTGDKVKSCVRFNSNNRVYLGFLVASVGGTINSKIYCNITLHAIEETKILNNKTSELSSKDFYQLKLKSKNQIIEDFYYDTLHNEVEALASFFYFDSDNTGSQQLVIKTFTPGKGVNLEMVAMNSGFKLATATLASYSYNFDPSTGGSLHAIINPDESKSVCFKIASNGNFNDALYMVHFDEKSKKFDYEEIMIVEITKHLSAVLGDTHHFISPGFYPSQIAQIIARPIYKNNSKNVPTLYAYTFDIFARLNHDPVFKNIKIEFSLGTKKGKFVFGKSRIVTSPRALAELKETHLQNDTFEGAVTADTPFSDIVCLGSLADFAGESVVVGTPALVHQEDFNQIYALYKAPPFETQVVSMQPSLSISTSESVVKGLSTSIHSSWNAGYTVSARAQGLYGSINAHFTQSFGGSKMKMESNQDSLHINVTTGFSNIDGLHAYVSNFYTWTYPLYRKSLSEDSFGVMTIVVPDGYVDSNLTTRDKFFNYVQDYEIGNLLTYINSTPVGYSEDKLWFTKEQFTVNADASSGGTTLVYSKNNSTHKDETTSTEVSMNGSLSISLGTQNIGASVSGFFSSSNTENKGQSISRSDEFSLSFHSGIVNDAQYEYMVTPLVYTQEKNNMLMIDYEVKLTGAGWMDLLSFPQIILMRTFPFTTNKTLIHFSRSIRFNAAGSNKTDIEIHLFNQSFTKAGNIVCNVYFGEANYIGNDPDLTYCTLIKKLTLDSMEPLGREKLVLKDQTIPENTIVTIEIFNDVEELTKRYYWGVYPYEAFKDLKYN